MSAHESLLIPGAAYRQSLLEITVWGHLFYAVEIEEPHEATGGGDAVTGIHFHALLGTLMGFIDHANSALSMLGYDGPLLVRVQMMRVRGVPFLTFEGSEPNPHGAAPFDDTLAFELDTSSNAMAADREPLVGTIGKTILLGLNWTALAIGDEAVKGLIARAKEYSVWK
jgi:hypothetical protein